MSSPKYISITERKRIAIAYLLIKAGGKVVGAVLDRHAAIMAKAMGKRRSIYNIAKNWLEMQQSLEETDDSCEEGLTEALLIYNEETGYTGSMGFDVAEHDSEDPYTQGMTEGFSLFGVGNAWRRPAYKGCPECSTPLNKKANKVFHTPECSGAEETCWIPNPALWNQEGEFIDIGKNRSIMKFISPEEDHISLNWALISKPCDIEHDDIETHRHPSDPNRSIQILMVYNKAGILETCQKCLGTGNVYPSCNFCGEVGIIHRYDGAVENCPVCNNNRNGKRVEMSGISSSAGREASKAVLLTIQQDVDDCEIGLDFLEFMLNRDNTLKVRQAVRVDKKRQKNIKILARRAAEEGLTRQELDRLQKLKKATRIDEEWAWKSLILEAVEYGLLDIDWLRDRDSIRFSEEFEYTIPWTDSHGFTRELTVDEDAKLKLQAISRIINWTITTTNSLSEQDTSPRDELMAMFIPKAETWGPYELARELGDAELMIHKTTTSWSAYYIPTSHSEHFRTDSVTGYNPAINMSRSASTVTVVNTIMDKVFPLVGNPDLSLNDIGILAKELRGGRRPNQLTVGQVTGITEQDAASAKLFRGINNAKPTVAFKWKDSWYGLARKNGKWTSEKLESFRSADGISCWSSKTLREDGLHSALALMAATIFNNPRLLKQVRAIKNYTADQMVRGGRTKGDTNNIAKMQHRADLYRVAQVMYQWFPTNYKEGKKLPDLFYIRYSLNNSWHTVASRITDGAIFNKARAICTSNNWKWTEMTEPRGQWTVRHVQCLNPQHQAQIDNVIAQWLSDQSRNLNWALRQLESRIAESSNHWKTTYMAWHRERQHTRIWLTDVLGYTPNPDTIKYHGPIAKMATIGVAQPNQQASLQKIKTIRRSKNN